ncbi:MAG TPA: restriction endonuclease subunit S [Patescibacteria group bacterium]|nr:restriction endonuclease subunit S [Patescibacteria group bacterium]
MKNDWQIKKLIDFCENYKQDIVDGPFGSDLKRSDYTSEGAPVLKIQNIKDAGLEIKNMDYVSKNKYNKLIRHSFTNGDIIMTKLGDPLGVCAIVDNLDDGIIVADLVRIRAKYIDSKYLLYYLNSPENRSFINSQQKGTTRPRIRLDIVRQLPIPIPHEINEQRIIVKKLDQIFEKLDKAKENAEKNLQNSRELFESYLNSVLSNQSWQKRRLKDICDKLFAGGDLPKDDFSKVKTEKYNVPIFANGVKNRGLYGFTNIEKVKRPSITISARGTIGYSEVREESFYPVVRLIVLIPNEELIDLFFLYYITLNFEFSNTGTSIPQLTVPMIENIEISVPPVSVQKGIVKKLDELSKETKRLEENYKKKLADLEELKKSVLQKAFAGEL